MSIELRNQYRNTGVTIQDVVTYCRENFDKIWEDEDYKWRSLKHYRDHREALFSASDDQFAGILAEALHGTDNLLTGAMYYPYRMLCKFAEMDPIKVRTMLNKLFDENIELETRYLEFRASADECLEEYRRLPGKDGSKALNHYQDARAISVYLSFEYPEKYFLFKTRMYTKFRDLVGFRESTKTGQGNKGVWKLENYARLCEDVLQAVRSDSELCSRLEEAVKNDPTCKVEDELHLLTQTIIYVGHYTDSAQILAASNPSVLSDETDDDNAGDSEIADVSLNTILYGPPGTGKTYQTVNYAVSIIENEPLERIKGRGYETVLEQYKKYKKEGLIEFVTFHQSYGYEEFVEGIKPVLQENEAEESALEYQLVPGVFRAFCEKAAQPVFQADDFKLNSDPKIWKVSLKGTGDNEVRSDCMKNDYIRIGWDRFGPDLEDGTKIDRGKTILNAFYNKMRIGDIVLSCYSATTIDAIGVVTGEPEWHDDLSEYKRVRPVQWLIKGIQEDITEMNGGANMTLSTVYRLNISLDDVLELIQKHRPAVAIPESKKQNHVFIIDEINRGNISKIFGELITLVEASKRIGKEEELRVRLPYSQKLFGVPDNVFLLGTMNTADRSIAILDTALRRRFDFVEMQPDLKPLEGIEVEGIIISEMLRRINERITILYDREHTIGQSYFIPLRDTPTMDCLAGIFKNSIVPLLQEYFFDDYDKIRLVLADNQKPEELQFITKLAVDIPSLFGNTEEDFNIEANYIIHEDVFEKKPEAYLKIYQ